LVLHTAEAAAASMTSRRVLAIAAMRRESSFGPTLHSAASAGHGSYLGHQRRCGTTGEM